ncbi:hypothetical protein THAOC_29460, partial [Thalassiosira oceanica]
GRGFDFIFSGDLEKKKFCLRPEETVSDWHISHDHLGHAKVFLATSFRVFVSNLRYKATEDEVTVVHVERDELVALSVASAWGLCGAWRHGGGTGGRRRRRDHSVSVRGRQDVGSNVRLGEKGRARAIAEARQRNATKKGRKPIALGGKPNQPGHRAGRPPKRKRDTDEAFSSQPTFAEAPSPPADEDFEAADGGFKPDDEHSIGGDDDSEIDDDEEDREMMPDDYSDAQSDDEDECDIDDEDWEAGDEERNEDTGPVKSPNKEKKTRNRRRIKPGHGSSLYNKLKRVCKDYKRSQRTLVDTNGHSNASIRSLQGCMVLVRACRVL